MIKMEVTRPPSREQYVVLYNKYWTTCEELEDCRITISEQDETIKKLRDSIALLRRELNKAKYKLIRLEDPILKDISSV